MMPCCLDEPLLYPNKPLDKKEKDLSEKEYNCITSLRPDNVCHHMNKDVIQIFIALRKAVTSHMSEKIR